MISTDIQFADVAQAVEEGFSKQPKRLPSRLFYDETGDKIFQEIMRMPEYYLTACEYEILQMQKDKLLKYFYQSETQFNLVELGAGDGFKTEVLLKHFLKERTDFEFSPVDVSSNVLAQLSERLILTLPELAVKPINKNYFEAIDEMNDDEVRKVFLFLGANIGNMIASEASHFTRKIGNAMKKGDLLLIGFDLKKDPRLIQAAYDDAHGITRSFNLNLLVRLNRELGAQFQLDQFSHYPFYNPESGLASSYLISKLDQNVYFEACDKYVHFDRWEMIHTEVSQKYDLEMIESLARASGLTVVEVFYDCKHYFCDVLMRR